MGAKQGVELGEDHHSRHVTPAPPHQPLSLRQEGLSPLVSQTPGVVLAEDHHSRHVTPAPPHQCLYLEGRGLSLRVSRPPSPPSPAAWWK